MPTSSIPARRLIYQNLFEFEQKKTRLDQLFSKTFEKYILSEKDRRFARNVISGTIRHLSYLDWLAAGLYRGRYRKLLNKTKSLLRPALYEIIFLDHIPDHATVNEYVKLAGKIAGNNQSKLINAILRNFLRLPNVPDPKEEISDSRDRISIQYSFPEWMVERWISLWGERETEKMCGYMNQPPVFDLRVNTAKVSRVDLLEELSNSGVQVSPSKSMEQYLKISGLQSFLAGEWLKQGFCTVQDESAGIPVELLSLEKGDWFLDICSAPGGKFSQVLEKNIKGIRAVAMDSDKNRLKRVKQNADRYPGHTAQFVVADGRALPFKIKFNKILLDAPCSGLGVIRKHPDIKWRRALKDVIEFSELQYELLSAASSQLAGSGRLVYSTCTIDPLENENMIDRFLQNNHAFRRGEIADNMRGDNSSDSIITVPHRHDMDGSFAALLTC